MSTIILEQDGITLKATANLFIVRDNSGVIGRTSIFPKNATGLKLAISKYDDYMSEHMLRLLDKAVLDEAQDVSSLGERAPLEVLGGLTETPHSAVTARYTHYWRTNADGNTVKCQFTQAHCNFLGWNLDKFGLNFKNAMVLVDMWNRDGYHTGYKYALVEEKGT